MTAQRRMIESGQVFLWHIEVAYQNRRLRARRAAFTGFTAEIIQHEVNHCNGIII